MTPAPYSTNKYYQEFRDRIFNIQRGGAEGGHFRQKISQHLTSKGCVTFVGKFSNIQGGI